MGPINRSGKVIQLNKLMPMNEKQDIESVLSELFGKRAGNIKPGLDRMNDALDFFPQLTSKPSTQSPVRVLVGGTNGKGSTTGMLFHLLSAIGVRTGLYTSPHLCHFSERIQVTNLGINDISLVGELAKIQNILPKKLYEDMSFFELTTLLSAVVFSESKCSVEVYEVGLGGKWDSTNVFDADLSAIVSIDYDHQEWLGNTIEEIAADKLGISRHGKSLYWSEECAQKEKDSLLSLVSKRQKSDGFLFKNIDDLVTVHSKIEFSVNISGYFGQKFRFPDWVVNSPEVMKRNFLLAFLMLIEVIEKLPAITSELAIETCEMALSLFGKPSVHWPPSLIGRFQRLDVESPAKDSAAVKTQNLIVDVCHNIDSVRKFKESLNAFSNLESGKTHPGIISIAKDKDIRPMVQELRRVLSPLVVFKINSDRSITKEILGEENQDLEFCRSFDEAWKFALSHFSEDCTPWVICGSFFTVGEVLDYFGAFPEQPQMQPVLKGSYRF